MRLGYVMSRFPSVTETFIVNEIRALERRGAQVEVFPLVRQDVEVLHDDVRPILERAHFMPIFSSTVAGAQAMWLGAKPAALLGAWARAITGNLPSWKFLLRSPVVMAKAAAFARRMEALGIEHIHAHFGTHAALAAYLVHRLTGIPYSITIHAHDLYVDRTMLAEKLDCAAFVVTVSDYNRRMISDLYGDAVASRTHVIRCGVNTSIFRPEPHDRITGAFRVVCVASLQEYKGHPYLIDACGRLVAYGIPVRCVLIGDGEKRPVLERQIEREGLGPHVTLAGAQPREQVLRMIAEADAFVLPSVTTAQGKKEGVPVALMEALACERPVVASAISGIPELVRHEETGLLVPERDPEALAGMLKRLHENPDLARTLSANGRRHVLSEFDLEANVDRLAALFGIQAVSRDANSAEPVAAEAR